MLWHHIMLLLDVAGVLGSLVLMQLFWTNVEFLRPFFFLKVILLFLFCWLLAGDLLLLADSPYAVIAQEPIRSFVFRAPLVCGIWYIAWKINGS